jgi:hypothetical protein
VISAAVTNDSLVVMLCSLALLLALRWQRQTSVGMITPFALGAVAGGAIITKLNSLPVVCFLIGSLLVAGGKPFAEKVRHFAIALGGGLASTGWWFFYNHFNSRGWLGQKGVSTWLNERLPGLISTVAWTDQERFLNFVPSQLFQTIWYNGGWNQFVLPFAFNLILALTAGVCCWQTSIALFRGNEMHRKFDPGLLLVMGCCLAALASVFIIARTTTQAEGRIAYSGLSAFAIMAVMGSVRMCSPRLRIGLLLWPTVLLLLNAYVIARFVLPFRAI